MIFTKFTLYFEVYEGRVKATELHANRSIEYTCKGLNHPRSLMGDFLA